VLATLVGPMGTVAAYEIEPPIAAAAERHLVRFENVTVTASTAAAGDLPESDIIYVNAASPQPLTAWLDALGRGGRLLFPWQPDDELGLSVMITRTPAGFSAKVLGPSRFIPLKTDAGPPITLGGADRVRRVASLVRTRDRAPDDTAVAVFEQHWF